MIIRQEIYDLYWYFAFERQNVFLRKKDCQQYPWTNDEILQTYKFCNSYRVNDRISQYLLKNVVYTKRKYSSEDIIFRIVLFKIFNLETTWELLEKEIGNITISSFDFSRYSKILTLAHNQGSKLYNDAYISCATKAYGYDHKYDNHLALLNKMFVVDKVASKIIEAKSMRESFNLLKTYPLIGNFMAYQLITDINYSNIVDYPEDSFTVAGPGAIRGIKKCFISLGNSSYEDIIKYMYEHQNEEFKRLGYNFKRIGDRPLQYIDCQNIFCELDKYCRVAHPDLKSNRTKIKKKYEPKTTKIIYFYPPKWKISNT